MASEAVSEQVYFKVRKKLGESAEQSMIDGQFVRQLPARTFIKSDTASKDAR